jgi:hypothetical protein
MVKPMDKLERRLKEDAGLISADLSPELQERIRASLESTHPADQTPQRSQTEGIRLWWASSLTGLAAAALIIVFINWNDEEITDPVPSGTTWPIPAGFPLKAETAEWTSPLEEELRNLQSDLEKAREEVERDLRLSF